MQITGAFKGGGLMLSCVKGPFQGLCLQELLKSKAMYLSQVEGSGM